MTDTSSANRDRRATCTWAGIAAALVLTGAGLASCVRLPYIGPAVTLTPEPSSTAPPTATSTPAPTASPTFTPYIPQWPILRRGDSGLPEVFALQRLLRYHGYVVVADGRFGSQTEDAVRIAQSPFGEPVGGVVGPITWSALVQGVEIQQGDTGEAVRAAEHLLNKFRTPVTVNGTFEQTDVAALEIFEAAVGLPPDGVLHEIIWRALVAIMPSAEPSLSYP